ncbi:MAG: hypothetical protein AAFV29_27415, partial [Myxococcota bacterium]
MSGPTEQERPKPPMSPMSDSAKSLLQAADVDPAPGAHQRGWKRLEAAAKGQTHATMSVPPLLIASAVMALAAVWMAHRYVSQPAPLTVVSTLGTISYRDRAVLAGDTADNLVTLKIERDASMTAMIGDRARIVARGPLWLQADWNRRAGSVRIDATGEGTLRSEVQRSEAPYVVRMEGWAVAALGTIFTVRHVAPRQIEVDVEESRVRVTKDDREKILAAGESERFGPKNRRRNEAPALVSPSVATADDAAIKGFAVRSTSEGVDAPSRTALMVPPLIV